MDGLQEDLRAIMDDNDCSLVLHAMANEATRRMKLAMHLGMKHDYWYQVSNVLRSSAMLLEKVNSKEEDEDEKNHGKKKEGISRQD
jgi:hypothetical protein